MLAAWCIVPSLLATCCAVSIPTFNPPPDGPVTKVIKYDPEEFFILQNASALMIYGTDVELTDMFWNKALDLLVYGTTVSLPVEMKFFPKHSSEGSVRRVELHMQRLVVPVGGATIDLQGARGESPKEGIRAEDGKNLGQAGTVGEIGGIGGSGGVAVIVAGEIVGGPLTVIVDGGKGGQGQQGGNGYRGETADGYDKTEGGVDKCCLGLPTKGLQGKEGGAGGKGGDGGQGGTPGFAQVLFGTVFDESAPLPNVSVSQQSGAGGKRALPGQPGVGGIGGKGAPMTCKRLDVWGRDKRCFPPFDETGPDGIEGVMPDNATDGPTGVQAAAAVVEKKPLSELRNHDCMDYLRYEVWKADQLYRSGDFESAAKLYKWTESAREAPVPDCEQVLEPWREASLEASTRIQQIQRGFDFWGNDPNHVPLQTFENLLEAAQIQISMTSRAEEVFDVLKDSAITEDGTRGLVMDQIKDLDYQINAMTEQLSAWLQDILVVKPEVVDIDTKLGAAYVTLGQVGQTCDVDMEKKAAQESFGWRPTLEKVGRFLKNTVVSSHIVARDLFITGMSIWATAKVTKTLVVDYGDSAMDASTAGDDYKQKFGSFWTTVVMGSQPVVETLISTMREVKGTFSSEGKNAQDTLEEIQAEFEDSKSEIDDRIKTVKSNRHNEEMFKWLMDIPSCATLESEFTALTDLAEMLDSKISQHDVLVLKFAKLTAVRAKTMKDRTTLLSQSVGKFNMINAMQAVAAGETYYRLKEAIVDSLKQLRAAMNYEFCEQVAFRYDDVRVVQLEGFLSDISVERVRKRNKDSSSRAILANFEGVHPTAATSIKIQYNNGHNTEFNNFWSTGTFSFQLKADALELPKGVANMRVVSAQAFAKQLLQSEGSQHATAEIWIKRQGVSQCTDVRGDTFTFAHSPQSYYSMFSAGEETSITGSNVKYLTALEVNQGVVGPSPVGTWEFSMPQLTTESERSRVSEIQLDLVLSFIPCETPECTGEADNSVVAAARGQQIASHFGMLASFSPILAGVSLTLLMALGLVAKRRQHRTLALPTACDGLEEQVDPAVSARQRVV